MIPIKSPHDIDRMRRAGAITGRALRRVGRLVAPGVTTRELDACVRDTLKAYNARAAFLGYNGFPASACISLNSEVIHGIPGRRRLQSGDIVSIDVGAIVDGYYGDAACTYLVGDVSPEARRLVEVTRQSFYEGLRFARVGCRMSDVSAAVQSYVEREGFSVVRAFTGHGIGRALHEEPEVPNFGAPGHGPRLTPGMTFCIEPMVCAGGYDIRVLPDGWTVVTQDGSLSAHYEHTVLITDGEPELLTDVPEDET